MINTIEDVQSPVLPEVNENSESEQSKYQKKDALALIENQPKELVPWDIKTVASSIILLESKIQLLQKAREKLREFEDNSAARQQIINETFLLDKKITDILNINFDKGIDKWKLAQFFASMVMNTYILNGDNRKDMPPLGEFISNLAKILQEFPYKVQELITTNNALGLSELIAPYSGLPIKRIGRATGRFIIEENKYNSMCSSEVAISDIPYPLLRRDSNNETAYGMLKQLLEDHFGKAIISTYNYGYLTENQKQEIGKSRSEYFREKRGWMVGDPDIDQYENISKHYVLRTLSATRIIGYSRSHSHKLNSITVDSTRDNIISALQSIDALPFGDEGLNTDIREIAKHNSGLKEKLENEAGIKVDQETKYPSTSEQIADRLHEILIKEGDELHTIEEQIKHTAPEGLKFMIIERMMPPDTNLGVDSNNESIPFLVELMKEMAAQAFASGDSNLWLIQCDRSFKLYLKAMFGTSAILDLANIMQVKNDVEADSPDTFKAKKDACYTILLDIDQSLTNVLEKNPKFGKDTIERTIEINPSLKEKFSKRLSSSLQEK